MNTLRKYLIAGLLVWLPLTATVFIIKLVVDLLDLTILLLPVEYQPEALLGFSVPGLGVILAISILIITGMLAANLLGRQLVGLWEGLPDPAGQNYLQQHQTDHHHGPDLGR